MPAEASHRLPERTILSEPGTSWAQDWDDLYSGRRCPLCQSLGEEDNDHALLVARGRYVDVRIDRDSAVPGYCVVIWNRGHVAELAQLDPTDLAGYWSEVSAVGRAIDRGFSPMKLNYQVLGNMVPHLHTHVLPRYREDPAPGGPLPWSAFHGELLMITKSRRGSITESRTRS